jgi:hypothetical protein
MKSREEEAPAAPLVHAGVQGRDRGIVPPRGDQYLRLVFANEPAERLTDLRDRFDTALS